MLTNLKLIVSLMTMISVEETLKKYLEALALQDYELAIDFFADEATVLFREGSYFGKFQIKMILKNTFSIIKDETFDIRNLTWNFKSKDFATCTFEFDWSGIIQGRRFASPGRGSLSWANINDKWQIVLEHFGPMPN